MYSIETGPSAFTIWSKVICFSGLSACCLRSLYFTRKAKHQELGFDILYASILGEKIWSKNPGEFSFKREPPFFLFHWHLSLGLQPAASCISYWLGNSVALAILSQCRAANKPYLWKNLATTVAPWHAAAKRVRCPSAFSSANVLWFLEFSSDHCNPKTKWQNACLGHQERQMQFLGTGLHGFLGEPKNTNLTLWPPWFGIVKLNPLVGNFY